MMPTDPSPPTQAITDALGDADSFILDSRSYGFETGADGTVVQPPRCETWQLHGLNPVERFAKTGVGDFLTPNDPALPMADALRRCIRLEVVEHRRGVELRIVADLALWRDTFGTTDAADLERRLASHRGA